MEEQKDFLKIKEKKWVAFCMANASKINQWHNSHSGPLGKDQPPQIPAVWNDKIQDFVWVPRRHRRG